MPYITIANSKKILRKIIISEMTNNFSGAIYKKPIYIFSAWEKNFLLLMQQLYKDPFSFEETYVFSPIVKTDTYKYIYESDQPPAYHSVRTCERLNADYCNFEIPFEIRERAISYAKSLSLNDEEIDEYIKEQITIFRKWFQSAEILALYKNDPDQFVRKLDIRWNIQRNVKEIEKKNSGNENFTNYSLSDLESEIDSVLREIGRYYVANQNLQGVIRNFEKKTFLAYYPYNQKSIVNNNSGLSDDELREFLHNYNIRFKKPLMDLLSIYYRVKFNPELSFQGTLLEKLNFQKCYSCFDSDETDCLIGISSNDTIEDRLIEMECEYAYMPIF